MTDVPFTLNEVGGNNPQTTPAKTFTKLEQTNHIPDVSSVQEASGMWLPVDLPSMGLAGYPATIFARKFGPMDLVRINVARKSNSFPALVAALGMTVKGVDIAAMTTGDFDYLMSWHLIMSYQTSRTKITWRSRYLYENASFVDKTSRSTIVLKDLDAVREMQARGYDFPRIGDELWRIARQDENNLSDEDEALLQMATFVKVTNPIDIQAKLDFIRNQEDLTFYEGIEDWRKVANHGVSDTVKLTCAHFKPEDAETRIDEHLYQLQLANLAMDTDSLALMQSLLQERSELIRLASEGRLHEAKPIEEEITIPLDANAFFPVAL